MYKNAHHRTTRHNSTFVHTIYSKMCISKGHIYIHSIFVGFSILEHIFLRLRKPAAGAAPFSVFLGIIPHFVQRAAKRIMYLCAIYDIILVYLQIEGENDNVLQSPPQAPLRFWGVENLF